jgi:hypothetical protein
MSAPTGGWFAISRADMERVLTSAGERDGTTRFAVWAAVISLCNLHQTCDLIAPVGMIARLAGLGYKATLRALHALAGIDLLEIEERRVLGKTGREPSLYRVKASTPPCGLPTQGSGTKATRVVAYNPPLGAEIYNKDSKESINKLTKREAVSDTADKLTPENFPERAQAANGGRLTDDQLEAFVNYWLERDPKGRCRFQGERFFEVTKRIATWASRERVAPAHAAAAKPERPVWQDCARRCRHWDSEKRWCQKYVRTEPKSCEHCKEF